MREIKKKRERNGEREKKEWEKERNWELKGKERQKKTGGR